MFNKNLCFKILSLTAFLPLTVQADQQFSLGLGKSYGGFLGGKYAFNFERSKVYIGAGFLGDSHSSSPLPGYAIGFEYLIAGSEHTAGVSYGTVVGSYTDDDFIGPSVNYTFYFSGFDARSWLLGVSAYYGEVDTTYRGVRYQETKKGLYLTAGFQF